MVGRGKEQGLGCLLQGSLENSNSDRAQPLSHAYSASSTPPEPASTTPCLPLPAAIQRSSSLTGLSGRASGPQSAVQVPAQQAANSDSQRKLKMPSSPSTSSRSFSLPRPATSSYSSHSYSPLPNLPRLPREVKRSLIRPWLASPTTSHFSQNAPDQRLSTQLRSRSRITNLALYILLAWLAISTLINVRSWAEDKGVRWEKEGEGSSMGGGERTAGDASLEGLPRSITETLAPLTPELEEVDHLIVVAGSV